MQRRKIGNTSLEVSILGFGASPLGDVFARTDPAEGQRAVHYALDCGINFFDVSPYYGLTLAEERLGAALQGRREAAVLATKAGRYGVDAFDFSRQGIRDSLEASLKRLRTDHVDLLQAHDVEFGSARQILEETLPAMRSLQREGKVRYIGITSYSLKLLVRLAKAFPVDSLLSYCRYNLLFTDLEEFLTPFATEHGLGIINASPMMMGLLTPGGAPGWHPAGPEVLEAARRMREICKANGTDIAQVALQFCLMNPHVSCTLTGMSTVPETEANIASASAPINGVLLAELRAVLGGTRLQPWSSGRPENQDFSPRAAFETL